jgi:hypothetical protein
MITSESDGPGTSTPCQSDNVPNNEVSGSAANRSTRAPVASSPWHSTGVRSRSRIASAAVLAARIDENNPSVRPCAAPTRPAISVSCSADPTPSRPGGGRCFAM